MPKSAWEYDINLLRTAQTREELLLALPELLEARACAVNQHDSEMVACIDDGLYQKAVFLALPRNDTETDAQEFLATIWNAIH